MNPDLPGLRGRGFVGLRVVGDVHGDSRGFTAALEGARAARLFLVQLGDLTDYGPDAPGALRAALSMRSAGEGLFLLGNHDHKLRRALAGAQVRSPADALPRTLSQLRADPDGAALGEAARAAIVQAPAWLHLGPWLFVHAAFHPAMLLQPSPPEAALQRPEGALARALYGQVTGSTQADGYPERLLRWVDSIPPGLTVFCGHDRRSTDGRPWRRPGRAGGEAVFMDTGAGKGGHLSWVDLRWPG